MINNNYLNQITFMKKNAYIKPELSVYEIEVQEMIATSTTISEEKSYDNESVSNYYDADNRIWAD